MGHTKKVGSTGRFKGRYGVGVKKRVLAVENRMKAKFSCPFCGFERIGRNAAGLFECSKCGNMFTGGAYEPQTLVGKTINKMVSQKSFLEGAPVLIKAKESSFSDIEREVEAALFDKESGVSSDAKENKQKKKKKKGVEDSVKEAPIVDDEDGALVDSEGNGE